MSNHEMAKRYIKKQELIGVEVLDIELISNDRVRLIGVKNKEDRGRLVIPSFITDIGVGDDGSIGLLNGCKYSDVYIENKEDKDGMLLNIRGLCSGMESKQIKFGVKYPEYISDISSLFSGNSELESVDIDLSGSSALLYTDNMFN